MSTAKNIVENLLDGDDPKDYAYDRLEPSEGAIYIVRSGDSAPVTFENGEWTLEDGFYGLSSEVSEETYSHIVQDIFVSMAKGVRSGISNGYRWKFESE